jgi:hypothetical protein
MHRESAKRGAALGGSISDLEAPVRSYAWEDILIMSSFKLCGEPFHHVPLWTSDRRSREAAEELGCAWVEDSDG